MGSIDGTANGPFYRLVPGENASDASSVLTSTQPKSLVEYYEKVWWPRMVEVVKGESGANAKVATLLQSLNSNLKEAEQFSNYTQQVRNQTVQTAMKAIGRTETLCPEASLAQSALPLDFIARGISRQLQDRSLAQMSGSAQFPTTARGKVEYDRARVMDRASLGTCLNDGNDGTNADYCKNAKKEIANADVNAYTLLQAWAFQDDQGNVTMNPYNSSLAQRYINNLFGHSVFEPLPAALMSKNPPNNNVTQILGDQMTYMATLGTFMTPYNDEMGARMAVPNMKALPSLSAALDAAGYTGADKERLIAQAKVSRMASDYIRFKIYQTDPGTIVKQLPQGSASVENLVSLSIVKQMMQLELMYDMREEIKKTNLLLGAIGAVLSEPQYQDIRNRIQAVQRTPQ
jgi:hypothetical protein